MDNLLPNCQFQLWTANNPIQKRLNDGSGPQPPIICTGFTPLNNSPTFFTTNTGQLKVGDLVMISGNFWGYSGPGWVATPTAVRVQVVTPNVSFIAGPCPLVGVSPTVSGHCVVQPITVGNLGSTFRAADGWNKTSTLGTWADDFPLNLCAGSLRTIGIHKGTGVTEQLYWECPKIQVSKYTGRTIAFGVLVKGNLNWTPWIYDNIGGYKYSAGVVQSVANGFNFLSVTAVPTVGANNVRIGIDFNGSVGDVFYVGLPTAGFATSIESNDCGQNSHEIIRSVVHWNPPLLTPLAMTFPNIFYPNTSLYGYAGIDIEAISLGMCHRSVAMVKTKIEFNGADSPNTVFLTISEASLPRGTSIFGPETMTNRASDNNWLPLTQDGTFGLFVDRLGPSGVVGVNLSVTFDFDCVQLAMPPLSNCDS